MRKHVSFAAALLAGALMIPAAVAQDTEPEHTRQHGRKDKNSADRTDTANRATADVNFMNKAAQGGMAEVELGKLAQQKAANQAVKDFGSQMEKDHTKANDELKELAAKENVTLPTDLDAKDQALKSRLEKMSGAQFDKAYMDHMVRDHKEDVQEFKREATNGKDPEVKKWASDTLPTLEQHLQLAQQTDAKVKK